MENIEKTQKKKYVPTYFKNYCKEVDKGYLEIELEKCAKDSKLHFLKYMLNTKDFKLPNLGMYSIEKDTTYDVLARKAAQNNQYQTLNYLLESPDLKKHADINKVLREVVNYGNLEAVVYLLSSPELKNHANINCTYKSHRHEKENFLLYAIDRKNHELIEFLTTSSKLKEHINVAENDNLALYHAFLKEDLITIKFLLTDDKLKVHASLTSGCINILLMSQNKDILEYLVKDYGLHKNETVIKFIDSSKEHNKTLLIEHPNLAKQFMNYLDYLDSLFEVKNEHSRKIKM